MLKPTIQLRIGQQLAMTPQLQQAIRLLQLSTLELQAEIQENFENNPMLEQVEDDTEADDQTQGDNDGSDAGEAQSTEVESLLNDSGSASTQEEMPVDSSWDELYDMPATQSAATDGNERDFFENQGNADETLKEHLLWQMQLVNMSDLDQAIATSIIDSVDDDGYLVETLDAIWRTLAEPEFEFEFEEVEAVLHLLQQFDPVGCCARDLSECLSIQLRHMPTGTTWLPEAQTLVKDHLEELAGHNLKALARKMKLSETDLKQVIVLVQSLNPRPGAQLSKGVAEYIVPDVTVTKIEGKWRVELNADTAPRLRINPLYAGMVKRADTSADNTYLRNQLQEARWFIKSLLSRNETLLRVATAIVEQQRRFLEYGDEAMQPLVLRDIAEQLEMHESTISRVTTQKYMHTPRGIYEFKYFFSSHVATSDGGACSATAIRAMLRKLIDNESPAKPLSDSRIASILVSKGINVARRTVAKYREAMAVPPSNERKRSS